MTEAKDKYIRGIIEQRRGILEEIYTLYFPRIQTFILQNSGSQSDAQDIFQEGIMIIYTKASQENFIISCSFYTYLHAICRNLWLKHLRGKRQLKLTLTPDWEHIDPKDFEENSLEQEQFDLYWNKFRQLGKACQQLLDLFFQGNSMREITAKMGFGSEQYARKRKFQCKEKLLQMIREDAAFENISDHRQ